MSNSKNKEDAKRAIWNDHRLSDQAKLVAQIMIDFGLVSIPGESNEKKETAAYTLDHDGAAKNIMMIKELEPMWKTERGKQALIELQGCQEPGPEGLAKRIKIINRVKS